MWAPGRNKEKSTDGERPGTAVNGTPDKAAIVRGQRAAFCATTAPFFHR